MDSRKVYLLWALRVAGVGLVVDLCVLVGVTLALRSPVAMPSWWLVVAVCVVAGTYLGLVASAVLLVRGLTLRAKNSFSIGMAGIALMYLARQRDAPKVFAELQKSR